MNKEKEFDFELNLEFEGIKNPSEALNQLAKLYDNLSNLDKHILYNILPNANVEYELVDLEFGSIMSKVRQIFTSIPDDVLKDVLNPISWIGHILVFIKYRILLANQNNEINCKMDLEKLTSDINREIKKYAPKHLMILDVNNYYILNTINDITIQTKQLKNNEAFYYKSKIGNAKINNKSYVNMPKILKELGAQTIEQERVEVLKIKTIDLLSDKTTWKLIREGKQIEVRINHLEWLEDYHNRKIIIQPNDYLKVQLKIIYTSNPNLKSPKVTYEVLKVYEVILPEEIEDKKQSRLFD